MFRVEFFCDDKRLGDALRALTGLAIGNPAVQPVTNAKVSRGGALRQVTEGRLVDLFAAHLAKTKPKEFTARDVQTFLSNQGTAPGSFGYVLKQAIAAKLIRKKSTKFAGPGTKYVMIAAPKKAAKTKKAPAKTEA